MKASRITLPITLILALMTVAGPAMAQIKLTETETQKLYITVHTVGTAQTLDHKNVFNSTGAAVAKVEPGFQNAFGDLGFIGKFGKKQEIEVVFDLYLSSRNHPSSTYGNEGYMILRGVPENLARFAAGSVPASRSPHRRWSSGCYFGSGSVTVNVVPLVGSDTVNRHRTAVGLHDPAGNGQAETGPGYAPVSSPRRNGSKTNAA